MEKESILFTPGKIGPLTLRNRTIRAAAFESMCPGNAPPYNSDIAETCLTKTSAGAGLSPHPAVSISIPLPLSVE